MNDKGKYQVFLLLGANLGDPIEQFNRAKELISSVIGEIRKESSIYASPSWGDVGEQPDYLNQALMVRTDLAPLFLLEKVLDIETQLGRIRTVKWGARVMDIDILFIDSQIIHEANLKVPHPLFQDRNFAMIPMVELVPDKIHPVSGLTLSELLENTGDRSPVELFKSI